MERTNTMKILFKSKDGGKESTVTGYWLCEFKSLFSIVLLKFEGESREAYHTHAFNSISWVIKGKLTEYLYRSPVIKTYLPSLRPIITTRETFHKVSSTGTTWVLSFRGAWVSAWLEHTEKDSTYILTNGRIKL